MRRRSAAALALVMGAVLMAGGCGDEPSDAARATTRAGTPSATGTASSAATPRAVLAEAGLTLPSRAEDVTIETLDVPDYRAAYRLTMTMPLASAKQWCADDVHGGPLPAVVLSATQQQFLGVGSARDGSIVCSASWPQDVSWQRVLLAEPTGTGGAAAVTLAVYRMPAH